MNKQGLMVALAASVFLGACGSDGDQAETGTSPNDAMASAGARDAGEVAQQSASADEFGEGASVLAKWPGDGWYYPAAVASVEGSRYFVKYRDGHTAWLERADLQKDQVSVGSRVYCNWKNAGTYFPGVIASRQGESVKINYDDGDVEETTMRCIKVKGASGSVAPANPAAPQRAVNNIKLSDPATLRGKADKWQGCSIISSTIAVQALKEKNNPIFKDRMGASVVYNNLAIYLLVASGQSVSNARDTLKSKKYAQWSYIQEAARNNGVFRNFDEIKTEEDYCTNEFRNIPKKDYDTLYVMKNYDVSVGTEKFQ